MAHLSTYKFTHTFEDGFTVTLTTHSDRCDQVIEEFTAFLRGCQFSDVSIKDGLEAAADCIHVEKSEKY